MAASFDLHIANLASSSVEVVSKSFLFRFIDTALSDHRMFTPFMFEGSNDVLCYETRLLPLECHPVIIRFVVVVNVNINHCYNQCPKICGILGSIYTVVSLLAKSTLAEKHNEELDDNVHYSVADQRLTGPRLSNTT